MNLLAPRVQSESQGFGQGTAEVWTKSLRFIGCSPLGIDARYSGLPRVAVPAMDELGVDPLDICNEQGG